MLPDRPFMFHPKRALSAWRPFSAPEDDALCTGLKAHGIEWVIIVQDPVFQAAARHDEELLLRLERDFFRKMFLRNNAQEMYILYESAWMDWPQEDTKMLVEAYYKHGQNWSAILSDPGYTFNDICRSQSNEKWADLCDAFRKHCTANVKGLKMLPDWPFLFHPNRESPSWRPFTPVEDDTLCIGLKAHGTEWAMIVQSNDVFQASGRRDDELLMRCARDFFRKTLLSSKDIRLYTTLSGGRRRKRYREDTQTPPC
ncbi:hypothetical protein CPB85DRAFT_1029993 [Mucidula mucida]|nr:hypothetical protein CPB85DRAFT_1029993 [Mucidula mucida]